jgi:hypothetical protein
MKNVTRFFKKSVSIAIKAMIGIVILGVFFAAFYGYNNRLFLWEAKLIWPQEHFLSDKFKHGSTQDRSRMVVDLINSKKLLEIDSRKIPDLLGDETGDYYFNDSNFTYRLTEKGNADWILTLVTGENGKIKNVFIRKSCCSISKKILHGLIDAFGPLFIQ